jgi:hypothetical protein
MVLQRAISPVREEFDKETLSLRCYFVLQGKCWADILTFKLGGFFAFVSVRGLPFPSYLLYADDILLFCAASISNAKEILKILKDYAEISGQFHNPDKTSRRSSLALDSLIGISFIVYNGSWLSKPNSLSTTTSLTSASSPLGWALSTTS